MKNRVKSADEPYKEIARHILILILGILIAVTSYSGTVATLQSLQEFRVHYYISPILVLELLLFFLFSILTLTSAISFLSVFLLSNDLELLRAAPLSPYEFISGKFTELASLSSWVLLFFGIPTILAFGDFYDHPMFFYLIITLLLPLFLFLSTAFGALIVFTFSLFVPAYRAREFILIFSLLSIAGGYIWLRSDAGISEEAQALTDIVKLSLLSSEIPMYWMPSSWFAIIFANVLNGPPISLFPHLPLILGSTGLIVSLLYLGIRFQYDNLYSKTISCGKRGKKQETFLLPFTNYIKSLIPPIKRGFLIKELKLFLRDVTQSIQLVLLLTLCLIYLYNFQQFDLLHTVPPSTRTFWQAILSIANVMVGGIVTIAISARFVFPTISLEGRSWWLLKSSPLSTREILNQKLDFWYTIFIVPTLIIFGSGALALQLPPILIGLQLIIGLSLCHLALGTGMTHGAKNAYFDWDHPAELTSSLANLMFMLSCGLLFFLQLLPIALITILHSFATINYLGKGLLFELLTVLVTFLFVYWNYKHVSRSLDRAAERLELISH